jgi:hypothetical protein
MSLKREAKAFQFKTKSKSPYLLDFVEGFTVTVSSRLVINVLQNPDPCIYVFMYVQA